MSKADRAMGDIDAASSPSSQNSPEDPGKPIAPLTSANYGGVNSFQNVGMDQQCPGSTCDYTYPGFNDDAAQYMKQDHAGTLAIRNSAYNAAVPNSETSLIGKQDSDPPGA